MSRTTAPVYGNLVLKESFTMPVLMERMEQVSEHFFKERNFSTYLVSGKGKRFYGLDMAELKETYSSLFPDIKSISSSISSPHGKGVQLSLRFDKKGQGQGHFVVATGSKGINEEIVEMFLGTWYPRPEPEPIALLDILEGVRRFQKEKEKKVAKAKKPIRPKPRTLKKERYIDPHISINTIIDLLRELSVIYLEDAPFNFELAGNISSVQLGTSVETLRKYFRSERAKIHGLRMDAGTTDGELIDMQIIFDPLAKRARARIHIHSIEAEEIFELITESLKLTRAAQKKQKVVATAKENFYFVREQFQIDALISFMRKISPSILGKARASIAIRHRNNEQFITRRYVDLAQFYLLNRSTIKQIMVKFDQPTTKRFLKLNLVFGTESQPSKGSLAIQWGASRLIFLSIRLFGKKCLYY